MWSSEPPSGKAPARDASAGRLQADHAAGGRGEADRAARVGADRREGEPGRRRHARAARRHTREAGRVPRVPRNRQRRVVARHRELGLIELPDDHRARFAQLAHDSRIARGGHRVEDLRRRGGRHARDVAQVLHADRHAVQRTAHAAGRELLLGRTRFLERAVGEHGEVGVERGIARLDARELDARELDRRELPAVQAFAGLGEGREEIGVAHPRRVQRRPWPRRPRSERTSPLSPLLFEGEPCRPFF
jgi:hypothetical protein